MSEDEFLPGIVNARIELKTAAHARIVNRPPGQRARHFGDVLLRIAAVDAESVQFHQLAPIVFVETSLRARGALRLGRRLGSGCDFSLGRSLRARLHTL